MRMRRERHEEKKRKVGEKVTSEKNSRLPTKIEQGAWGGRNRRFCEKKKRESRVGKR